MRSTPPRRHAVEVSRAGEEIGDLSDLCGQTCLRACRCKTTARRLRRAIAPSVNLAPQEGDAPMVEHLENAASSMIGSCLAREALASVEEQWNAAAFTWDVEALAMIYTEDAVMFGGRPGLTSGRQQIRQYFASYRHILRSTTLQLIEQQVIELGPDTFVAQGFGAFEFTLMNGRRSETVLRTTLTIVKREGRWRVVRHHFSPTPEAPPIPE